MPWPLVVSQTPSPYPQVSACYNHNNNFSLSHHIRSVSWEGKEEIDTYLDANIQSLGHPVGRDTGASAGRETVDVLGGGAAVVVDVAGEAGLVVGVADEEDGLDGVEGGAGQLGEGVGGGGCALRVAFEDEAFVGVGAEGGGDLVDDLWGVGLNLEEGDGEVGDTYVGGAGGGVLAGAGWVDGVVLWLLVVGSMGGGVSATYDLAAGLLGADVGIHGAEARGLALGLTGATGVDDGWRGCQYQELGEMPVMSRGSYCSWSSQPGEPQWEQRQGWRWQWWP